MRKIRSFFFFFFLCSFLFSSFLIPFCLFPFLSLFPILERTCNCSSFTLAKNRSFFPFFLYLSLFNFLSFLCSFSLFSFLSDRPFFFLFLKGLAIAPVSRLKKTDALFAKNYPNSLSQFEEFIKLQDPQGSFATLRGLIGRSGSQVLPYGYVFFFFILSFPSFFSFLSFLLFLWVPFLDFWNNFWICSFFSSFTLKFFFLCFFSVSFLVCNSS